MVRRFASLPIGCALLASAAFAADEKAPAHPPAAKAAKAQPVKPQQKQAPRPDPHPGEQLLERLRQMSPDEREKALENLPPARRQNITNRLNQIEKWPTAAQARERARLERLNGLPQQRQNQVRRSARQFLDLPEDRRRQMTEELRRMAPLPDDERRAYMNTEEFRNRYSPNEQQIMSNLAEIEP